MANKSSVADVAKNQLKSDSSQVQKRQQTIFDLIQAQQKGFELALPKGWDAGRFTRIAITALKNNPKLQQCSQESVLGSLMLSAQLGLEPNSPLHEASIIPYGKDAQFQIEYRGLLKLVWNSGLVTLIDFDKVCEKDDFEFAKGFNPTFVHKPELKSERGEAYCYYAYAEIQGGGKALVVMSRNEVLEHAKKFSATYNKQKDDFSGKYGNKPGAWDTDFDSMAIKTVLKQLSDKKLPKRTANESLLFAAIDKDNKVNSLDSKYFGSDEKIKIDDLQTKSEFDEADIEEAKTTDINTSDGVQWDITESIIEKINSFEDNQSLGAWKKKNKTNLSKTTLGELYDTIDAAIQHKESDLLRVGK